MEISMGILKKIFCKHQNLRFSRYLHGDEINHHDGKRWEYVCADCGAYIYTYRALSCVGCGYLCYNGDGSGACLKKLEHECISNDNLLWTEKSVAQFYDRTETLNQ